MLSNIALSNLFPNMLSDLLDFMEIVRLLLAATRINGLKNEWTYSSFVYVHWSQIKSHITEWQCTTKDF